MGSDSEYEKSDGDEGGGLKMEKCKKMEEALRESEEKYRKLFKEALDAIFVADAETGIIIDCNRAASEMVGREKSELIGEHQRILHPPREIEGEFSRTFKQHLKEKEGQVLETQVITKKGGIKEVAIKANIFELEGKKLIQGIFRDNTERKKAEEKLKLLKEFNEKVIDSLGDALVVIDPNDYTIISANKAALKQLKLRKEDMIGKTCYETTHHRSTPCKPPHHTCPIRQVLKTGKAMTVEHTHFDEDNNEIFVEILVSPVRNQEGKIVQVVHLARDVTERKKAEGELIRLSSAAKMSTDSIVIGDLDAKIIDVNEATLKMYGIDDKGDLIGKNSFDLIAPEDREKALAGMKEVLKKGYIKGREYHIIIKDGSKIPVDMSTAIMKDADGKPTGFVAVSRDISERKRAEEALRRSEVEARLLLEFRNKVIDTAVAWIDLLDAEGNVTLWNRGAELISGYSREEVVGHKKIWEWLYPDPEYRAKVFAEAKKIIERGERVENFETTIRCKDGALKTISWYSNNILDEKGNPAGSIAVGVDITERKRFEERLSALNTYSRNLNTAKSMEEIYELTLDAAEKCLGFEYVDILIMEGKMLCLMTYRGWSKVSSLELPLDGDGITVRAARTGKPVLVPDVSKEKAYVEVGVNMRSELAVPIKIGHRVLGVLNVESKKLSAFNEKDQELLEILASHAATAISNLEYAKNLETYAREIRESQEKFERLFMSNPEAAVYLDPDSHILDVNPRFEELFGYSLDEIKGMHINDVVVPKDKMEEGKMLDKKAEEGYVYYDTVRKRKDGSLVPVSISAAPLIVEGQFLGVMGVYKDITQQKKAEEALRRSEEQARRLLEFQNKVIDTADVWINLIDEVGNVTLWNRAAELISGYSREEVTGHMDWEFEWLYPDPKYRAEIFAETKKIIETGELMENDETAITCKDGTLKTIRWYCNNILDEKGKPAGLISVGIDVTERKRFEERLSALNTYSRNSNRAESMEEIYRLTLDAMEKTLGFEHASFMVVDKGMLYVVDQRGFPDSHASLKLPLNGTKGGVTVKAAKTGRPVLVPDTKKERAYVEGAPGMRSELAVPIKTGHRLLGVLNVESKTLDAFDEKDQKLLEILASHAATAISNLEYAKNLEKLVQERTKKLKETHERLLKSERLAAIGQLAAMVGHDLRNPLQAITNASYVINELVKRMDFAGEKSSYFPPPLREEMFEAYTQLMSMMNIVDESTKYGNKIVSDLQDFARTKEPELMEVNLESLIQETLPAISIPRNVRVSIRCDQALSKLCVDPTQMRRVFTNLTTNAIQAMPKGGELTISTSLKDGFASIAFQDTGVGIPKEDTEKLFTPLFTMKSKGVGLGLTICKNLVEAHGGSIEVESQEGKGSTFTVKLPVKKGGETSSEEGKHPDRG